MEDRRQHNRPQHILREPLMLNPNPDQETALEMATDLLLENQTKCLETHNRILLFGSHHKGQVGISSFLLAPSTFPAIADPSMMEGDPDWAVIDSLVFPAKPGVHDKIGLYPTHVGDAAVAYTMLMVYAHGRGPVFRIYGLKEVTHRIHGEIICPDPDAVLAAQGDFPRDSIYCPPKFREQMMDAAGRVTWPKNSNHRERNRRIKRRVRFESQRQSLFTGNNVGAAMAGSDWLGLQEAPAKPVQDKTVPHVEEAAPEMAAAPAPGEPAAKDQTGDAPYGELSQF